MANDYFHFKSFSIYQDKCAMKVTTDGCLFGAWVADELKDREVTTLLDIGTGTGLLSLMVAQQTSCRIDAVEVDQGAAAQAGQNVAASPWAERIKVIHDDAKKLSGKLYDVIISNPPFYQDELSSPDAGRNLAHHGTGLQPADLLEVIERNLTPGGIFYLLLPFKTWARSQALLIQKNIAIAKKVIVKASVTHPPFRVMIAAGFGDKVLTPLSDEFSIKDQHGDYTSGFTRLLRPYYQKLA